MFERAGRRSVAGALALALAGTLLVAAGWAVASAPPAAASVRADHPATGYWMVAGDGGIFSYGSASFHGSTGGMHLNQPVVGMAATPNGAGYWMVARDGGIFNFGDAPFWGSTGAMPLTQPIVGMAASPSGRGYWLVAGDGGVFTFGDAVFWGSAGALRLNRPIVAMARTPSGRGYWLVASDGGIFTYGDAKFFGSTGAIKLNQPIVAMAASPTGEGYWLIAADGGVFTFGDAKFFGSTGAIKLNRPVITASATPSGNGYWLMASDGGVFSFGDAPFFGSAGNLPLVSPVVGAAAVQPDVAPELVAFYYPWYSNPHYGTDQFWRHWNQSCCPVGDLRNPDPPFNDLASDFYPVEGPYSSSNPGVIDQDMTWLNQAGVDEIIVSWWGQGDWTDLKLPGVMQSAAAHGIKVGIHLEPYGGRSAASVAGDIAYLKNKGISDVWVYSATDIAASDWAPLLSSLSGIRVFATGAGPPSSLAAFAEAAGFTGIYTYDGYNNSGATFPAFCGAARSHGLLCSPSVAPGFSSMRAEGQDPSRVKSRNHGATYDDMWQGAITAGADVVSVTSFNEWHEGTQIEPAEAGQCAFDSNGDPTYCYTSYDGDYGLTGAAASRVYIDRTNFWVGVWRHPNG